MCVCVYPTVTYEPHCAGYVAFTWLEWKNKGEILQMAPVFHVSIN